MDGHGRYLPSVLFSVEDKTNLELSHVLALDQAIRRINLLRQHQPQRSCITTFVTDGKLIESVWWDGEYKRSGLALISDSSEMLSYWFSENCKLMNYSGFDLGVSLPFPITQTATILSAYPIQTAKILSSNISHVVPSVIELVVEVQESNQNLEKKYEEKKVQKYFVFKAFPQKDEKLKSKLDIEFQNYLYLKQQLPTQSSWIWYPTLLVDKLITLGNFTGFVITHGGRSLLSYVARKGPLGEFFQHTTNKHFKHMQLLTCMQGFTEFVGLLSEKKLVHFDISPGNCIVNWDSEKQEFSRGYLVDYASLSTNSREVKYVTFTRMFLSYRHLLSLQKSPTQPLFASVDDDLESLFYTFLYVVNPSLPLFQLKGQSLLEARSLFMKTGSYNEWVDYFREVTPIKFKKLVLLFAQLANCLFTEKKTVWYSQDCKRLFTNGG